MTPERIQKVIKKLREIADTNYSDYAGFHLEDASNQGYYHCFTVNNQPYHSSNLTLRLEEYSDALKIIAGFLCNPGKIPLWNCRNREKLTKTARYSYIT